MQKQYLLDHVGRDSSVPDIKNWQNRQQPGVWAEIHRLNLSQAAARPSPICKKPSNGLDFVKQDKQKPN